MSIVGLFVVILIVASLIPLCWVIGLAFVAVVRQMAYDDQVEQARLLEAAELAMELDSAQEAEDCYTDDDDDSSDPDRPVHCNIYTIPTGKLRSVSVKLSEIAKEIGRQ